jgi:pimeloyl-ACP methyl ester carboxylesterase
MATIVLVHGGWHTPSMYSKFSTGLKALGHEVHIPHLPSMNGSRPPNADLYTDTALVRSYVNSLVDAGREVTVLMHSYGGQVGTNALVGLGAETRKLQGLAGGVIRLVYICAFALPEGGSMIGVVRSFGHEDLMPIAFDFAEDDTCLDRDPKSLLVGSGLTDEDLDAYVSRLERWNGKCMYQEIQKSSWREIPISYIYTTKDMTVPLDYQVSMVEKLRAEGREVQTFELETGHCPTITMPKEMVDIVDSVVRKA